MQITPDSETDAQRIQREHKAMKQRAKEYKETLDQEILAAMRQDNPERVQALKEALKMLDHIASI